MMKVIILMLKQTFYLLYLACVDIGAFGWMPSINVAALMHLTRICSSNHSEGLCLLGYFAKLLGFWVKVYVYKSGTVGIFG